MTSQGPDELRLELERLRLDRANVLTQTRAQILNEGIKLLLLINGGGAAALAALLQAIWDKPAATPMP